MKSKKPPFTLPVRLILLRYFNLLRTQCISFNISSTYNDKALLIENAPILLRYFNLLRTTCTSFDISFIPKDKALSIDEASKAERSLIVGFSISGAFFWLGLSGLMFFYSYISWCGDFGTIVLRKLIELLLLSTFGLLCFQMW